MTFWEKPACPQKAKGDADCDGKVTLADYATWRKEYTGQTSTRTADFNADGRVTLADHQIWRNNYR